MKWYLEHLETADRVLIETLETALERGAGHYLTTPNGQAVYVSEIDETYVVLRYGLDLELELRIPRAIRDVAIDQARTLAELRNGGAPI